MCCGKTLLPKTVLLVPSSGGLADRFVSDIDLPERAVLIRRRVRWLVLLGHLYENRRAQSAAMRRRGCCRQHNNGRSVVGGVQHRAAIGGTSTWRAPVLSRSRASF